MTTFPPPPFGPEKNNIFQTIHLNFSFYPIVKFFIATQVHNMFNTTNFKSLSFIPVKLCYIIEKKDLTYISEKSMKNWHNKGKS